MALEVFKEKSKKMNMGTRNEDKSVFVQVGFKRVSAGLIGGIFLSSNYV
jgi:hypothetical protein